MNILQNIAQESAISVLEHFTNRPALRSLDLFPDGLFFPDVVEVAGEDCKSLILTHLVCQVVAPRDVGGCQAGVLLVDLDHKVKTQDLVDCVSARLEALEVESVEKRSLVKAALRRLHVVRVYNFEGLRKCFADFAPFLASHSDVALVAVDGLGSHFHSERLTADNNQFYDSYARQQLKRLREALAVFKVSIIYTKASIYSDRKPTKRAQEVTKRVIVTDGAKEESTRLLQVIYGKSTAEVLLSIRDCSHVSFDRL